MTPCERIYGKSNGNNCISIVKQSIVNHIVNCCFQLRIYTFWFKSILQLFPAWNLMQIFKDGNLSMTHYLCMVWQFIPVIVIYKSFQEFTFRFTVASWFLRMIQKDFAFQLWSLTFSHCFSLIILENICGIVTMSYVSDIQ